jgi:hypothetical protein
LVTPPDQWLALFFICQHHNFPQDWRTQFAGTGSSARDIGAEAAVARA